MYIYIYVCVCIYVCMLVSIHAHIAFYIDESFGFMKINRFLFGSTQHHVATHPATHTLNTLCTHSATPATHKQYYLDLPATHAAPQAATRTALNTPCNTPCNTRPVHRNTH